ncbi:MAG: SDR family NAD(P)-dependent oxidoreductase [Anaerolineales bacterium]|nr:SDR family NAD(P)-dependent oxidoreductase [Chloroflexota bacterium]MBL6980110.1 SDR family NAD(P)-dependent oxidoreductase [Anaerolineales bacterium]
MPKEKWATANIPDMQGKTIIITGANSGIGYEAARALAAKRATLIMACRSLDKGHQAIQQILAESPEADLKLMTLNLADLSSVRQFAQNFRSNYDKLDVLVNNAGVMAIPYQKTIDGFEMQFGVNHLGHFALTGLLLDLLLKTEGSRVVTISSYAHRYGWINFNDLNGERFHYRWIAYCQSKLANLLFAYELQRRLSQSGAKTVSLGAHPGYTETNLQQHSWFYGQLLNPLIAQSQEMGALPTLYAATADDIVGDEYIGPDGFLGQRGYPHKINSGRLTRNKNLGKRLWEVSEEMTGVKYDF